MWMARHFGHVEGHPVGSIYASRAELSQARVHGPPMAGIWGTPSEGASSIVVNGGYRDDADHGDLIFYTGHGGQQSGVQVEDQRLDDSGNAALVRSELSGLPLRVTRGHRARTVLAPAEGFRYDGLYQAVGHSSRMGADGFLIWQFRLERAPEEADFVVARTRTPPEGNANPARATGMAQRVVRMTAVSEWVKRRHDYTCQVCGTRLEAAGAAGYAEGAHIRPLGRPHSGPDIASNVLCLCPNHHVLLDKGGISIDNDLTVRDQAGTQISQLRKARGHVVGADFLKFHREIWTLAQQPDVKH